MPRSLRFLALAFPALVIALGGCGDSGSGQDTGALLQDTFSGGKPMHSGRLALSVDVAGEGVAGLPAPLRVALHGPFQSVAGARVPKFDFDLDLATKDGKVSVGAISTGTRGWVKIAGHAYTMSDRQYRGLGGDGAPGTGSGNGVSLASLGVDPRRWLDGVRDEGVETLAGDRVVHLTADVDVARLLADIDALLSRAGTSGLGGSALPKGLSAATRADLERRVTDATVGVWTGERDHRLRRLLVDVAVDGGSGADGRLRLDLSVAGLDRTQAIGPPANPRPMSELTAALAVLGARSGGAPQAATGPTGATGGSGDYATCVGAAGSDLKALQKCAPLLR